jgi:hypothetical protein
VSGPATAEPWPPPTPDRPAPAVTWYKRRWFLVTTAVLIVVAIAVITDLPTPTSNADDAQAETTIISQINTDVAPCVYSVREAMLIYVDHRSGSLPATSKAQVPSLLRDDEDACSLTDASVFDLSDIDVIGTPAGKRIADAVAISTNWVTSDALGVVDSIVVLLAHPRDRQALAQLAVAQHRMTGDDDDVMADVEAASKDVDRTLPPVNLATGSLPSPSQFLPAT